MTYRDSSVGYHCMNIAMSMLHDVSRLNFELSGHRLPNYMLVWPKMLVIRDVQTGIVRLKAVFCS